MAAGVKYGAQETSESFNFARDVVDAVLFRQMLIKIYCARHFFVSQRINYHDISSDRLRDESIFVLFFVMKLTDWLLESITNKNNLAN